jgi:hypothetical protein
MILAPFFNKNSYLRGTYDLPTACLLSRCRLRIPRLKVQQQKTGLTGRFIHSLPLV